MMNYNRVVVKIGTSTLAHATGRLNIRRVERLVKTLADIKNTGREIILVTSGSIGVGAGKLGYSRRPEDLPGKQACAAVGQCELMYIYDKLFGEYHHIVAQVLLTQHSLNGGKRQQNVANTFRALINKNVIPIVNANDTVSTNEIEFGDNDTLSAKISCFVKADLLLILSDIDGLYDSNPSVNPDATLIEHVHEINDELRQIASGRGSSLGTGGMITKLMAAEIAGSERIPTIIMNGREPERIYDLFDGKKIGTLFELKEKTDE